jgi:spermidine dehydrogenase
MAIQITRRDFLNGVAIAAGGSLLAPTSVFGQRAQSAITPGQQGAYYPPTLTGMRGSHPGSFEVAHALAWRGEKPEHYQGLDEHYDLVVVGAGMSGLAAAWYYLKKMGPDARILLLDNHDDFGGHAKRNEFHHDGRMILSLGGAQNIDNPGATYSELATDLLTDLGLNQEALDSMAENMQAPYPLGFAKDGANVMSMPGPDGHITVDGNWQRLMLGKGDYATAVEALPIPTEEQDILIDLFGAEHDYLDEMSLSEKYEYATSVSYNQFLVERVGLASDTLPILDATHAMFSGVTGWSITLVEAFAATAPGLQGMGWLGELATSLSILLVDNFVEVRMFPDGNASVARLLVQKMIPEVAPAMKGVEDVAITRFDYSALDRDNQATRLRLNSTVVGVRETKGKHVEVDYVQQGTALRITAKHCIMAGYNGLIPHLCPELPQSQKEALRYGVKIPFVYANVLLDNGRAFNKLGANMITCPYDPFQVLTSAPATTSGGYEPPRGAEDPMSVLMMNSPVPAPKGNETGRDMLRMGRHKVYATTFESYERQIRDQLQGMLGQHGFNHETDIRAITVNRLPHGYAYSYLGLYDPEWAEGQAPHEIGRAQFGRISIANSDAEATALMQAAWDAAFRAVEEQTS